MLNATMPSSIWAQMMCFLFHHGELVEFNLRLNCPIAFSQIPAEASQLFHSTKIKPSHADVLFSISPCTSSSSNSIQRCWEGSLIRRRPGRTCDQMIYCPPGSFKVPQYHSVVLKHPFMTSKFNVRPHSRSQQAFPPSLSIMFKERFSCKWNINTSLCPGWYALDLMESE